MDAVSEVETPAPSHAGRRPDTRFGMAFLTGTVTALVTVLAWILIEDRPLRAFVPFEDAAMLFRYVEMAAHGAGITWNAGMAPGLTDGATDLGFVLLLTPLVRLGLTPEQAAIGTSLVSVTLIGGLLAALASARLRLRTWQLVLLVAFIMSGPANRFTISGFSVMVFAAILLSTFVLVLLGRSQRSATMRLALLALGAALAGAAGWWRPEGFALGPIALVSAALVALPEGSGVPGGRSSTRWREVLQPALVSLAVFLIVAVAWVAFRLAYFGHLVPSSAVVKGGGIDWTNAPVSLAVYVSALLPLVGLLLATSLRRNRTAWALAVLGLATSLCYLLAMPQVWFEQRDRMSLWHLALLATTVVLGALFIWLALTAAKSDRRAWIFVGALAASSLIWVFVNPLNNHWWRMQWPMVPTLCALLLCVLPVARSFTGPVGRGRRLVVALCLAGLALVSVVTQHLGKGYYEMPFHVAVSSALSAVDTRDVRLATTEAGLIPLAISGQALDTFGLNDRPIAESHGAALDARLDSFTPNVLVVHGPPVTGPEAATCPIGGPEGSWLSMVEKLYAYADRAPLELLRSDVTGPCEAWSVFVDPALASPVRAALGNYAFDATPQP